MRCAAGLAGARPGAMRWRKPCNCLPLTGTPGGYPDACAQPRPARFAGARARAARFAATPPDRLALARQRRRKRAPGPGASLGDASGSRCRMTRSAACSSGACASCCRLQPNPAGRLAGPPRSPGPHLPRGGRSGRDQPRAAAGRLALAQVCLGSRRRPCVFFRFFPLGNFQVFLFFFRAFFLFVSRAGRASGPAGLTFLVRRVRTSVRRRARDSAHTHARASVRPCVRASARMSAQFRAHLRSAAPCSYLRPYTRAGGA